MVATKLTAGQPFPNIELPLLDGSTIELGKPGNGTDWKMVVIYRGQHCPLCTRYLNLLEGFKERLQKINIDLAVASGDSETQLKQHMPKLTISYPICYGLSIAQMQELGLYISKPRSEQETDHPFAEPGLFVINDKGQTQIIDISNGPFARPELETLVSGLEFIRSNDYPIRGTY